MLRTVSTLLFALLLLAAGVHVTRASDPALPPLPSLNDPASDVQIPGKFIWADLFTSDLEAERRFYATLFGWEWRWISQHPEHPYGMFYNDEIAVAGIAHRDAPEQGADYARWVHYISTPDVSEAAERAVDRGGRILLPRRSIANRGDFAVLADPEHVPFGVMHSSSGDPADFRVGFGEWLWVGLASRDATAAAKFYESLVGYRVHEPADGFDVLEFVLAAGGHSRAGIGQLREGSDSKPTWLGFVRVEKLEAILEKVRAAGGEVLYDPENDGNNGDLAIIADPFGAPVGLMRWIYDDEDSAEQEPKS